MLYLVNGDVTDNFTGEKVVFTQRIVEAVDEECATDKYWEYWDDKDHTCLECKAYPIIT